MNRPLLSGISSLLLVSLVVTQAGAGEAPAPAAKAERPLEIPFSRFELPNGLTVILHEDHRLPLVSVNLWYHVGSKDEPPGRSGFAHIFEHLMFMGTEKHPYPEFDTLIEAAGGSNNATTSSDRTNYFESGPKELLETFLALEADRMAGIGAAMTQEKLDTQREVVRNERRQRYENRPYGAVHLEIPRRIYPPEHPYHQPVIGSHEDLQAASVEDVKDFFSRFYFPRNASLVIAGDFDPDEAKKLVEKHFGPLPSRPGIRRGTAPPASIQGTLRATITDEVELPLSIFVYHSPALYRHGDADLDVVASILGGGKSSRLYERLVYEKKLAQQVSVRQSSSALSSQLLVQALARPGVSQNELEAELDAEIERFQAEGPTQREVDRARNGIETAFWQEIEGLAQRADLLNRYQFHFGDPGGIGRDLERYAAVTPESAKRWAREVMKKDGRLILRVVPAGREEEPGGAKPPAPPEAAAAATETESPPPARAEPRPAPPLVPAPEVFELSNGLEVWYLRSSELPLVALEVVLRAGSAADPAGKEGLAALAATMLDEGAGGRGALELAGEIDFLGAELSLAARREFSSLSLQVLERNLDPALDLFADILLRPAFDAAEWQRVKQLWINDLVQRRENPVEVARVVAGRAFYGDGHPYSHPESGYEESVRRIELADVRAFYERRYRPDNAVLLVTGNLSAGELQARLEARLGGWKKEGTPPAPPSPPARPLRSGARLVIVDKPGAPQTVIFIQLPAPELASAALAPLSLASSIFGETFTSRLMMNLREKNKFTYGARSSLAAHRAAGHLIAASSVHSEKTGPALVEFWREFQEMAGGRLLPEEIGKARATHRSNLTAAQETRSGLLGLFASSAANGLPPAERAAFHERVLSASPAEIAARAREFFSWERAVVVLVGDRRLIEAQLAEIEAAAPLDAEGRSFSCPAPELRDREGALAR
jgi:zinc protease